MRALQTWWWGCRWSARARAEYIYGIDGCAGCVPVSNGQCWVAATHQSSVVVLTVADVVLPIPLPARPGCFGYCHRHRWRDSSSAQGATVPTSFSFFFLNQRIYIPLGVRPVAARRWGGGCLVCT